MTTVLFTQSPPRTHQCGGGLYKRALTNSQVFSQYEQKIKKLGELVLNDRTADAMHLFYELKSIENTTNSIKCWQETLKYYEVLLRNKAREIVRNWNSQIQDESKKAKAYQEMLKYAELIAIDELKLSPLPPMFPVPKKFSLGSREICHTCEENSVDILTKILQGNCFMYIGQLQKAHDIYSKIAGRYPKLYLLNLSIGKMYLAMKKGNTAFDVFLNIIDHYPNEVAPYIGAALAQEEMKMPLLAYDWIVKAKAVNPNNQKVIDLHIEFQNKYGFSY